MNNFAYYTIVLYIIYYYIICYNMYNIKLQNIELIIIISYDVGKYILYIFYVGTTYYRYTMYNHSNCFYRQWSKSMEPRI